MTFVWALELGRYGITVNAMAPAGATRMTANLYEKADYEPPPTLDPALNRSASRGCGRSWPTSGC
jgi:NAD(P)-dependent dehydrogenase (short-subunit alcohol dehydrogenase family)